MTTSIPFMYRLLVLGTLYGALIGTVHCVILPSATYAEHPGLMSAALLFDLTVWPLLAVYKLFAQPRRWSAVRLGLVGVALLRLGLVWLPAVPVADELGWPLALGALEAGILVIAGWRIRTITRTYRALRRTHDAETALHGALASVVGERVARIGLMEAEVVYYALLAWRRSASVPAGAVAVTTHRQSGQLALLWGLLGISLIELAAVHLVLTRWSPTAALWVTALSAYGCLVLLALINAIRVRPSYLTADALHLRLDLRWQAVISLAQVAFVSPITDKLPKQPDTLNAALLTAPNVLITLREPVQVRGLYGTERMVSRITLFVDEPSTVLTP